MSKSVLIISTCHRKEAHRMKRLSIYLLALVMLFQTMVCSAAAENIGYSDVDAGAWYAELEAERESERKARPPLSKGTACTGTHRGR